MNLLRRMKLRKTAALITVATIFLATYQAVINQVQGQETQAGFRIKITVPETDRPAFFVPVNGTFALSPAKADKVGQQSEDLPSYIKVSPFREGNVVRIKVSVLYGKLDKRTTVEADQLNSLKQKSVTEFVAAEGDKITVSELKRFGVKPLEIEIYSSEITP